MVEPGLRASLILDQSNDTRLSHLAAIFRSAEDELSARHIPFVVVVLPHAGHDVEHPILASAEAQTLVEAAQRAGVRRFVLLSIRGAVESHPLELFRAKAAAERTLRPTSLDWTIIRPTAYLETWLTVIGEKLPHGPALVFGRGKNPINMVSVEDVADVVVACLDDPAASRKSIEVTGPANLTMVDLARALGAGKVRYIPRAGLRTLSLLTRPISPAFARQSATALFLDTEDMTAPPFVAARTTVSDVLASWRSVGAR